MISKERLEELFRAAIKLNENSEWIIQQKELDLPTNENDDYYEDYIIHE